MTSIKPSRWMIPSKTIIVVMDPEVLISGIGKNINIEIINKNRPDNNLLWRQNNNSCLGLEITDTLFK